MSILIFAIIILIVIALVVYAEGFLSPPLDNSLVRIIQALTIIIGALLIANRSGIV